jgi:hypothetical protein
MTISVEPRHGQRNWTLSIALTKIINCISLASRNLLDRAIHSLALIALAPEIGELKSAAQLLGRLSIPIFHDGIESSRSVAARFREPYTSMTLLKRVTSICRRLAPLGWANLFALHGLRLDSSTLGSPAKLLAELTRELSNIDRTVEGFRDFCPDGRRGIESGNPGASLLYHAFASPLIHPFHPPTKVKNGYPTLEDLDTIENFIYARARTSVRKLRKAMRKDSRLVLAVFAIQYRIGARCPNGRFADLAFSRVGVSRVGTTDPEYDCWRRSFWPVVKNSEFQIRALPARFAAFLAEWRKPTPQDSISNEQAGDDDRTFLFPVHKLFKGKECLRGLDIKPRFSELHRNEKLQRVHTKTGIGLPPKGLNPKEPPFVRTSKFDRHLVRMDKIGASILLTPVPDRQFIRLAFQRNFVTRRKEIARFIVPARDKSKDNRYADSSFQFVDPVHAERRPGPEYVNIRHQVLDPVNPSRIRDLNSLDKSKFTALTDAGGYEAAHYTDNTCEGCITAADLALRLDEPDSTNFAAYSLVSAPDFFPLVDQADVTDWVITVLGRSGEREHFAQGGPRPLSARRVCVNPELLRRGRGNVAAFSVRDPNSTERTETLTTLVSGSRTNHSGELTNDGERYLDPSTTFLGDAASGIFDPGWDVSFDGDDKADFLASNGLGSPFPEDAKLCAALNSFWPSVAPDATRTFGLFPPEWNATTSIPLMDDELGLHARHPFVLSKKASESTGWDGEQGPFFERNCTAVNYRDIAQSDYVTNALQGKFTLTALSRVTPFEFFGRMNAIRACIQVLPPRPEDEPKQVSSTKHFLVSAQRVGEWTERNDRADPRLQGQGYLFRFAILGRELKSKDHGRIVRRVDESYLCQIGSAGVCWRRDDIRGSFHFSGTPVFVGT